MEATYQRNFSDRSEQDLIVSRLRRELSAPRHDPIAFGRTKRSCAARIGCLFLRSRISRCCGAPNVAITSGKWTPVRRAEGELMTGLIATLLDFFGRLDAKSALEMECGDIFLRVVREKVGGEERSDERRVSKAG
jgi:hypothetical protein